MAEQLEVAVRCEPPVHQPGRNKDGLGVTGCPHCGLINSGGWRPVPAGALLIEDGFDAALERYLVAEWGEEWPQISERGREIRRDQKRPLFRAAVGDGK